MSRKKIVACLDNRNGKVVKGVKFKEIKELGDPVDMGVKYAEDGVDELAFYDISASLEERTLFTDILRDLTSKVDVPVNAAGGIMSLEQCREVFDAGAAKVSINTGAIRRPLFVKEAAEEFGSGRVTVSVDIGSTETGYRVFSSGGQMDTGLDAIEWIKKMQDYGAGSFIINSIDCDGVKKGFDLDLLKMATEAVQVPITASGGAGSIDDFVELFQKVPDIDAGLAASIFHYGIVDIAELKTRLKEKGIETWT